MCECVNDAALVELAEEEKEVSDGFNILGLVFLCDLWCEERSVDVKETLYIPNDKCHWCLITVIWSYLQSWMQVGRREEVSSIRECELRNEREEREIAWRDGKCIQDISG